jgi:inner membrane protein
VRTRSPRARASLALALLVAFLLADWTYQRVGPSLLAGGALDETAHLLTGALALLAVGRRLEGPFARAALVASVAIDLDHVPGELGMRWLTAGTPRPYTHSLIVLTLPALAAACSRRHRAVALGILFGLAVHFWRDLGETGSSIALLWPASARGASVPHSIVLASVCAASAIAIARDLWERSSSRAGRHPSPVRVEQRVLA